MSLETFSNQLLEWLVRLAGLFWLAGAFMLFRQIRTERLLDRMAAKLERATPETPTAAPDPATRWKNRDDAACRGWIAGQAVVLAATSVSMLLLHPFSAWLAALLV